MITGAGRRQTHSLLDWKKQQWAKERQEIAHTDETFSSHLSSTSHHKFHRTSVRTYYSNLDLSESRNNSRREQHFHQSQEPQTHLIGKSTIMPVAQQQYAQNSIRKQYPHPSMESSQLYDYNGRYDVDVDTGNDADFEDNYTSYRRAGREKYVPRGGADQQQRNHTTSILSLMPGNDKYSYDDELLPTTLQTANARIQHQRRARSPILPVIDHHEYAAAQQECNIPKKHQANKIGGADPGNRNNRFNSIHGCQEEDTSGYLSDSPTKVHTPEVWFNDGASQSGSISGSAMCSTAGVEGGNEVDAIGTRFHRSIQGQQISNCHPKKQLEKAQPLLNSTYVVHSNGISNQNALGYERPEAKINNYTVGYYTPSISPSSSSNTYQITPVEQAESYSNTHEDRERAKWSSCNGNIQQPKQDAPGWLNRAPPSANTCDDDDQGEQATYLRGQNIPLDDYTRAERLDKRRKAVIYGDEIKMQMQEREMTKKQERDRLRKEELLAEERFQRQQQLEKERVESERQQKLQRAEVLRKKEQTMLDAIAKAEMEAKLEKQMRKRIRVAPLHAQLEEQHTDQNMKPKSVTYLNKSVELEKKPTKLAISQKPKAKMDTTEIMPTDHLDTKESQVQPQVQHLTHTKEQEEMEEEKVLIGTPINLKLTVKQPVKQKIDSKLSMVESEKTLGGESNNKVIQRSTAYMPLPIVDLMSINTASGDNIQVTTLVVQYQCTPEKTSKLIAEPTTQRTLSSISTADGYQHENMSNTKDLFTNCSDTSDIASVCQTPELTVSTPLHMQLLDNNDSNKLTLIALSTPKDTFHSPEHSDNNIDRQDTGTQTEPSLNCDLCLFHDNFYKVLLKREVSTTTTTQTSKTNLKPAKETEKGHEMTTTTTTTTTTTFKAKAKDKDKEKKAQHNKYLSSKMDTRPKWGVNRPVVQYVKASERDPFYLRNKKRNGTKTSRSQSLDSRLNEALARDQTILKGTSDEVEDDVEAEEGFLLKARNVCTEILPIKTDEKGRIFLNFREASAFINEDEVKDKLRQRYFKFGRILPRRSWASTTFSAVPTGGGDKTDH